MSTPGSPRAHLAGAPEPAPTNHLDVEHIESLGDYEGTVLLVSHDRAILREARPACGRSMDRTRVDFDGPWLAGPYARGTTLESWSGRLTRYCTVDWRGHARVDTL